MAESSGRSTDETTGTGADGGVDAAVTSADATSTDATGAWSRAGASRAGSAPAGSSATGTGASTDDPATEQLPVADASGGATDDTASDGPRQQARSVPGGVGIPGRAAPRRVLGAHETMPGEESTDRTSGGGTTATAGAPGAETGSRETGSPETGATDDAPTTTLPAQSEEHRSGAGTAAAGAAAGAGATAWSQKRASGTTDSTAGTDTTATTALDTSGSDGSPATTRLETADHDEAVRTGAGHDTRDHDATDHDTGHRYATDRDGAGHEELDPAGAVAVDDRPAEVEPKVRRGTGDLGLLVLRLALGADLLGHGLQKLPGLFGGSGISGYTQLLSDGGFRQADVLAYVGAISEIGAGALLILGLLTPLAAAAAIGVLVNTWFFREAATPGEFQFFFSQGGAELEIVLLAVAVAVALAGPGRGALDARRRWATRPTWDGVLAVLVGAGAGVAVWFLLNGANPFA